MVRGQNHWKRKSQKRFSRMSSSKVDLFKSNQDQMITGPFYILYWMHFISGIFFICIIHQII